MARSDDTRSPQVAELCAAALGSARIALSGVTDILVGGADVDRMKESDAALHDLRETIDVLAPRTPATSGVRTAVAAAHVGGDMGRVAELTQQIGEIALSWRGKAAPMPPAVRAAVAAVSGTALMVVGRAEAVADLAGNGQYGAAASVTKAGEDLDRRFVAVAGGQRSLDEVLIRESPQVDVTDAVDAALLGRCYEGCARHAVTAVRHLAVLAADPPPGE